MKPLPEVNITGSRLLIVDDDEIIRKLLRRVFERGGFIVEESVSGESALESIDKKIPDLILLDVVMAGIDGFMTCRKIKEREGMDEIPIIFVTGRTDTGSIVEGLDAGGSDYITKPINRHEAVARIRNHLKMRVLMRFQREFIEMLKQANFAKNRVIGVASHDLRSPLASIRGLSEFLESSGPLNEDQIEIIQTIRNTSESMLHLVDELLDVSVIESGEDRTDLKPCSITDMVSAAINIFQFTANTKAIQIKLVDSGIPEQIMIDKIQFRRVIDNLLSNAIKYSPAESKILVTTFVEGEFLKIIVEDEGSGIPEDEMHKLFTDFGKTSVQPLGNESSTGLGLSICREIVEAHKGKIFAENRKDKCGARFIVELDLKCLVSK